MFKNNGLINLPVSHMRGGTSTGLVLREEFVPKSKKLREELLRYLMGVPQNGTVIKNNQITGLGRMVPTSNKVFFVAVETHEGKKRLVSTLAQLAATTAHIDWGINCGNMTSALLLWAYHEGILGLGNLEMDIYNTNTDIVITGRLTADGNKLKMTEIPGVNGAFPGVDLSLHHPTGAKTGKLLPTGEIREQICGIDASCVDVAVPMVIIKADDLGKTGNEPIEELSNDGDLMQKLQEIWIEAGLRMRLKDSDGELMTSNQLARSETIPKICMVSAPINSGSNISTRYFTPQKGHASLAVTGGCCLAAACLIEGSVAHEVARNITALRETTMETSVLIDNPVGTLGIIIVGHSNGEVVIHSAAYNRNAQMLLQGYTPLYHASSELADALTERET